MQRGRAGFPEECVDLLGDVLEGLGGVDGAVVVADEGVELMNGFLYRLLFQLAFRGDGTGVAPARGWGERGVEDEELGAEEGEFEVND